MYISTRHQLVLNGRCFYAGLDYLHNGCKPPIIHRDIKTSNILLTEKMQAKICDFGVSKLLSTETATHTMTDHVRGTRGYFDPE